MRKILMFLATAASTTVASLALLAAIAPVHAADYESCQANAKTTWVKCVFENARSGGG